MRPPRGMEVDGMRAGRSTGRASFMCYYCSNPVHLETARRSYFVCEECPSNGGMPKRCNHAYAKGDWAFHWPLKPSLLSLRKPGWNS